MAHRRQRDRRRITYRTVVPKRWIWYRADLRVIHRRRTRAVLRRQIYHRQAVVTWVTWERATAAVVVTIPTTRTDPLWNARESRKAGPINYAGWTEVMIVAPLHRSTPRVDFEGVCFFFFFFFRFVDNTRHPRRFDVADGHVLLKRTDFSICLYPGINANDENKEKKWRNICLEKITRCHNVETLYIYILYLCYIIYIYIYISCI